MRLNKQKCFFLRYSIEYLGHVVDEEGIHPTEENVKAIKRTLPQPMSHSFAHSWGWLTITTSSSPTWQLTSLPSTLSSANINGGPGMTSSKLPFNVPKMHCSQMLFLPTTTPPSHWYWHATPQIMVSGPYCHTLLMVVKKGPLHTFPEPSRQQLEKHYSQLEKEALAIIFAVKKFHRYLIGRHFTIESDHQPLKTLFGETRRIPNTAPTRIIRCAVIPSAYQYSI